MLAPECCDGDARRNRGAAPKLVRVCTERRFGTLAGEMPSREAVLEALEPRHRPRAAPSRDGARHGALDRDRRRARGRDDRADGRRLPAPLELRGPGAARGRERSKAFEEVTLGFDVMTRGRAAGADAEAARLRERAREGPLARRVDARARGVLRQGRRRQVDGDREPRGRAVASRASASASSTPTSTATRSRTCSGSTSSRSRWTR